MMIKYYEIANCSVVSSTNNNTGETRYCIYAPSNIPVELLQRYKFINDVRDGCNYKFLSNEEVAELYQNMSPDKQWSVIGNGRFVDEKDRQLSRKLCWVSTAMLVMPEILWFIETVIATTTTGAMEESNAVTSILSTISVLVSVFPLVGIITLVIARFKDPKSKFVKVLTVVYIVLAVISIIMAIVTAIVCGIGMASCLNELHNCD